MSKERLLRYVAIAGLVAARIGSAQSPAVPAHPAETRETIEAKTRIGRTYERTAHDALSRYFADNTFLVRAHVELVLPGEGDSDLGPDAVVPLPNLPGLPYQPERIPRSGGEIGPEDRIRAVDLDVLVDTAYTQRDRDFIQYLVVAAANMDTSRGDEVRVMRAAFPRDDRSLRKPRPMLPGSGPSVDTAVASSTKDTAKPAEPPKLSREFVERLIGQLPLLFVCASVLVGLWLLRRPSWKSLPGAMKDKLLKGGKRGATEPEPSARPVAAPAVQPLPQNPPNTGDLRSLRPFLVNSFIGDPRVCGKILGSWMEHDQAKGSHDAAILLSGLNPRLLDTVREIIGEGSARMVEAQMTTQEVVSDADFLVAAREFRREFQVATQHHGDRRQADLFGFLEQLNEGQILHILKDEPLGISGFALAQVSSAKAASILQGLDSPTRARFLYAIGSITQIPREVYKEIADRLSLKAMDVANMKFVAADGVESLIKLIENLPVEQQFPYIHSLSEVDLNLAKKLRARTVTLPEIPTLPEKFLSTRLQSTDPEILALVLPRFEKAARDKMFSLLPERMRALVQSSVEGHRNATPSEYEEAAKKLLQSIRDEIRRSGRPT